MSFFEICKGTVEDNVDPSQKARIKVRLDGYHTQTNVEGDAFGIPIEDLDWYPVLMPTTSSSRDGKGNSPSGINIGDRVVVWILDEYIQSVLVVGTVHGDGDISDLSNGGLDGLLSDSVSRTNNDLMRASKLNYKEYIRDLIENDDVGYETFMRALRFDEGFVQKPYYDQFKFPTIGIGTLLIKERNYPLSKSWEFVERKLGRKIPERKITFEEAMKLAENDINKILNEIPRYNLLNQAYNSMSQTRKYGLISMCYQMGTAGASKFSNSLQAMIDEDWERAYRSMMTSLWARQTPSRASRVASIIRDNNFSQYPMTVLGGGGSARFARSMKFLPSNTGGVVDKIGNFMDMTDIQLNIINKTISIRELMQIRSLEDLQKVMNTLLNFDEFISEIKDLYETIQENIKTLRDINIVDFIQRYLDRFKKEIEKLVDDAIKYVGGIASEAKETFDKLITVIKFISKKIKLDFDDIINKINNTVTDILDMFDQEEEEDEESGIMFSEPPSEYASEYPHLKTEISDSGHIREIDDTPGFERLKETHKSGTYREINADGRLVEKTVSDKYLFVKGDDHIHIEGNGKISIGGGLTIHITGDVQQVVYGDVQQVIRGSVKSEIDGNMEALIIGNSKLETRGNTDVLTLGNSKIDVRGNVDGVIHGTTSLNLKNDANINSDANINMTVKGNLSTVVDGNSDTHVKGTINLNGDGNVNIGGSRINFTRR